MKIVIVGGVAGGASAAARARRQDENAEIFLLQSGPDVSFASCGMPYFIGHEITSRPSMAVQTPQSLYAKLNINVKVNTRVTKIDTELKLVFATNELTRETFEVDYDELILAVGAEPFKPPIPGIDRNGLFSLRNLKDMDHIDHWIDTKMGDNPAEKMHCVVAGAGFVGLEMVEQLVHRGIRVTLVEMMPQILGPLDVEMALQLQRELESHGVDVITGDGIKEFQAVPGGDPDASILVLNSGRVLDPAQMTILGLGVRPDTKIVEQAGIECTRRGHIVVDDELHTSAPNVWGVGDAIEVRNPILGAEEKWSVPLAGPANRQGRMVADNIYGAKRKFKGTYGASVVRVFDLYAASVGLNEKMLKSKNLSFTSVHVHPGSHAGYFPGAKSIHLKLIFDPNDGKIYGAQAVGADGVEKRIDIISTAIQGNLTVEDLAEIELCYAPPVGSAKDPVNIAGMAAQNVLEGVAEQIDWSELLDEAARDDTVVLDVRGASEIKTNGELIPGTLNIPLNELRGRLNEIPKEKRVIVSCASGQRAYYGCRILKQSGYERVLNLSGAFKTYKNTPAYTGISETVIHN